MIKLILSVFLLAAANQGYASTYSFTELSKAQYDADVIAFLPNGTPRPYYPTWVPLEATYGFTQAQAGFTSSTDGGYSATLMDTNSAGIQVGKYSFTRHQHFNSMVNNARTVTGAWMVENKVGINLTYLFPQLTGATYISDAGQILVTTFNTATNTAGYGMLSVPSVAAVPVPATYTMMLTGLGLFGFMARSRRSLQA